jgi:hypothetical protein
METKIKINQDSLKPTREWKRLAIKEGSNIFRFLPPFGEAAQGYPYKKWVICWSLIDPKSGRMRPYASPIMTEKRCPITEWVKAINKKMEVVKGDLTTKGYNEQQSKEVLKPYSKVINAYQPRIGYVWNAVDKSGNVGLLELKSTAQKKIKELMTAYIRDYNQDPTSINSDIDDSGVWFDIIRTGQGFNTEYDAKKVQLMTKTNGQLTYVDDRSPLPESITSRWEDMAYDLSSLYPLVTYDELKNVLMWNMPEILKEYPEAEVAEFTPTANPNITSIPNEIPRASTSVPALKLEDNDDIPDFALPKETPLTPPLKSVQLQLDPAVPVQEPLKSAAPQAQTNDEIFAMANSILDGGNDF